MKNRIEVLHGVNLNMLGSRPTEHYGTLTFNDLQFNVSAFAKEFGFEVTQFQTNNEGAFCERLHRARELADGLILNPGAWTHYSYAIRDALEIACVPAVEVHLSDIDSREEFRHKSVIRDICIGTVSGRGVDGYRDAIAMLKTHLNE